MTYKLDLFRCNAFQSTMLIENAMIVARMRLFELSRIGNEGPNAPSLLRGNPTAN